MCAYCLAEGITFRYFEHSSHNILEHATVSFERGETTVILGNSGCGKSTLAAVLCGLYPENGGFLESGTVSVDGRALVSLPYRERSREIAQLFQNPDLQFTMGCLREELCFCLENACVPQADMDRKIALFADKYLVSDLLDRPFASLSGGEKQKAALCCLFLVNPKIMILDEPFANLDSDSRDAFLLLLGEKIREGETTVIAIDHQASNWLSLADRFLVLGEKGAVLRDRISAADLRKERVFLIQQGLNDPFATPDRTPHPSAVTDPNRSPVLSLQQASIFHKKNGAALLRQVTLSLPKGQIAACLGASGSGKTTFFLTLLGQKPYSGSILLDGQDLRRLNRRNRFSRIGIVFQNPGNQFIAQTVSEDVRQSLCIWKKCTADEAERYVRELLADYGLENYGKYSPYMLSQGQQRRLGVLSMLAGGQMLLLLDEPTYGQDGRTTKAIMDQLRKRAQNGLSVIFSTHDETLAYEYADRIWRVKEGTICEEH